MEIYEKTVEVLEPEVTKLMKFMYFQVRDRAGPSGPGQLRRPHLLDTGSGFLCRVLHSFYKTLSSALTHPRVSKTDKHLPPCSS